jgi:homocitrate synthase NifV
VLGKHSGTSAVIRAYEEFGVELSETLARQILLEIRDFAMANKRAPKISELRKFHIEALDEAA